jgi:hypothetical protein
MPLRPDVDKLPRPRRGQLYLPFIYVSAREQLAILMPIVTTGTPEKAK